MIGLDYFENFKYILSLQDIIYLYLLFGPVNRNQKFDYPCIGGCTSNKIYYTPLSGNLRLLLQTLFL